MLQSAGSLNVILGPKTRKKNPATPTKTPFDVFAEGLVSEKSRDDKTAIELFIAGIRGWEAGLRRQLDGGKSKRD